MDKRSKSIIYNLIITILENSMTQYDSIEDEAFIDYICKEANITKTEYKNLMTTNAMPDIAALWEFLNAPENKAQERTLLIYEKETGTYHYLKNECYIEDNEVQLSVWHSQDAVKQATNYTLSDSLQMENQKWTTDINGTAFHECKVVILIDDKSYVITNSQRYDTLIIEKEKK